VLQRLNTYVFPDPHAVMENIARVTSHLRTRISRAGGDPEREVLQLIPTLDGDQWYLDEEGRPWRMYLFIEQSEAFDTPVSRAHVHEAAKAFGRFTRYLSDLPGPRLHETIPAFHDTPQRLESLLRIVEQDPCTRVAGASTEIDFLTARQSELDEITRGLASGAIPHRVTHNDAKLSNVLLDSITGQALCVVDLDTVMPGSCLYDFGDLVRSAANPAGEDERDLSRVRLDCELFEALSGGYLEEAGSLLSPVERELLPFSAGLIATEQAIRFLTDYIQGDLYYRTFAPDHNLARARTQIALIKSMEHHSELMRSIVAKL
jgi:hypothetical protein